MNIINTNLTNLEICGLKEEVYNKFDVLLLPENIFKKNEDEELIDSETSIEFYKYLKSNGVKVANSIDLGLESKIKERRGAEFWLGVIQFIQHGMITMYWSLLSRFLYDKLKSKDLINSREEKSFNTNIHITVVTNDYKISYSGDAKKFLKIIKNLKN